MQKTLKCGLEFFVYFSLYLNLEVKQADFRFSPSNFQVHRGLVELQKCGKQNWWKSNSQLGHSFQISIFT